MTPQEVYDHVKAHVTKQGRRAVSADGECMYRTPDNLACAVGCLLTDEEARDLEVISQGNTLRYVGLGVLPDHLQPHFEMLTKLQEIHDASYLIEFDQRGIPWITAWQEHMTAFAEEKGLTP